MRRAHLLRGLTAALAAATLAACGGGDADPTAPCTPAQTRAELATATPLGAGWPPVLTVTIRSDGQPLHISGALLLANADVGIDRTVALRVLRDGLELAPLGQVAVPLGWRGQASFTFTDPSPAAGQRTYALEAIDTRNGASAWAMPGSTFTATTGACR